MDKEFKPSGLFVTPAYSDEDIQILMKEARDGNIPAKLNLIMHNQAIINAKLDALMEAELIKLGVKEAKDETA